MAALKCSRCRARIEVDGTSACSCPPAKGGKDARNFEAFRPRISTRGRDSLSGPAPDDSGRARLRGRSVMVCVASAVALGSVTFSLQAMDSGRDVRGGDRPAVTISPDPDIEAREAAEDSYGSTPDQPDTGGPSLPPDDGADGAAGNGADGGEHPGSQPPPSEDEDPAPPPDGDAGGGSGDADGGASNGGGDGDEGDGDGDEGGDDGGGNDDGGDDNGDDGDDGGGLLRGLITLLFGGGGDGDDRDHGKNGDRRGDGGHDRDGGKSHHRGGGHH